MTETVTIKIVVNTGFANCSHEDEEVMDKSVWDAMSESEQDEYLSQAAMDLRNNHVECAAWIE